MSVTQEFDKAKLKKITTLRSEDIQNFGFWNEIDSEPVDAVEIIVHEDCTIETWLFYGSMGGQPYDGWRTVRDIEDLDLRKLVRWTRKDHELYGFDRKYWGASINDARSYGY